jgi:hypothetical protein
MKNLVVLEKLIKTTPLLDQLVDAVPENALFVENKP